MKIGVIGSGTMGNGIAHTFALAGFQVLLIDTNPEALEKATYLISKNLKRQVDKELISEVQMSEAIKCISTGTDLESSVYDIDLAIEAAYEDEVIKLQIFQQLDRFCKPETILASNTSSISISHISSATRRPDKVIGMHFMNPVPLMKLVEVIKGRETSDSTFQTVRDIALKLNKVPVEVNDAPGFVANRVLMPMINEAIYALYEGVSGVEEIDTVMKLGMSHPMGPLQLADYIGLDVCLAIMKVMEVDFDSSKYSPCPLLIDMVEKGQKGIKAGIGFYDYGQSSSELKLAPRFNKTRKAD